MKRTLSLVILACVSGIAVGQPNADVGESAKKVAGEEARLDIEALKKLVGTFDKIPNLNVSADVLALSDSRFGLKYNLEYSWDLADRDGNVAGSQARLQFLSNGLVANEPDGTQDFVHAELRISGELFGRDPGTHQSRAKAISHGDLDEVAVTAAAMQKWTAETSEEEIIEANSNVEVRKRLEDRARDLVGREVSYFTNGTSSRFVTFDGHARVEADQTFEEHQFAIGFNATTDLDVITGDDRLTRALDTPFRLLRSGTTRHSWIPAPRFSVGYDYVTDAELAWRQALTDNDNYHRLAFEAAWRTSILEDVQLRAAWRATYELGAPQAVKDAGKEFSSYYDISLAIPSGMKGGAIVLSYSHGEIGPTLEGETLVGLGFRVEF